MEIDVKDYLSNEQMQQIAKKVFTEKMEEQVEVYLNNQYISVRENVFREVTEYYVTKLRPQYEEYVLDRCMRELDFQDKEGDTDIRDRIRWKLSTVVEEIITENKEQIKSNVKESIIKYCNIDVLADFVSKFVKKIDWKELFAE